MGAVKSTMVVRCEPSIAGEAATPSMPPPAMPRMETTEEKMWRKMKSQPLVPIGCAATAYFLFSGIKAFQRRDPVASQRMMRNRIAAQFVTLVCFIGYMGLEQTDFRLAPVFQDKKKAEQQLSTQHDRRNESGDNRTSS